MARKKELDEKNISFETAAAELETIVQALEKGDLPLEEAVSLFEKGVRLSRLCSGKLDMMLYKVFISFYKIKISLTKQHPGLTKVRQTGIRMVAER